jgi:hypothetical protein
MARRRPPGKLDPQAIAQWRYDQIVEALGPMAHDVRGEIIARISAVPTRWPVGPDATDRACHALSLARALRQTRTSRASARDVARIRAQREPASLGDELFERTRGAPALVDRVIAHALTRTPKTLGDGEPCEALDAAGL